MAGLFFNYKPFKKGFQIITLNYVYLSPTIGFKTAYSDIICIINRLLESGLYYHICHYSAAKTPLRNFFMMHARDSPLALSR
jgi:hypothetical protein